MRFYVIIAMGLALISVLGYMLSLYLDSKMIEQENTITTLWYEKNELEVEKTESDAKRAFTKVEDRIKIDSNKTRAYTNKMMENDDVEEFDDSF